MARAVSILLAGDDGTSITHRFLCAPTLAVKWNQRMGAQGMHKRLEQTLDTAKSGGLLKASEVLEIKGFQGRLENPDTPPFATFYELLPAEEASQLMPRFEFHAAPKKSENLV